MMIIKISFSLTKIWEDKNNILICHVIKDISMTILDIAMKFRMPILHIRSEGSVSQILFRTYFLFYVI